MFGKAALLAIACALGATTAHAQEAVFWKSVGDWDISIDTTIQNGCYALASWNGGTVLRIGRDPSRDNFYVLIGNDKWASLRPEEEYAISIQFGNRSPWDVSARGLQFNPGETVYLHAASAKMDFIREFQRALNMRISYDGSEIDNLKLTGSRKAWDEVEVCQREVARRGLGNSDDPFASGNSSNRSDGSGRKSEDPFAN
ncbi:MAG: hypothetical protein AAGP08_13395 [Pseudomonadota bacterium]